MMEANKKAEEDAKKEQEDAKQKKLNDLERIVSEQNKLLEFLLAKLKWTHRV